MAKQAGIAAFVFDLDGVLTDTAEYHFRAWKRLADEEGLSFTRDDNEYLRGISRRDSLLLILNGRVYPEQKMQAMMDRKNGHYLEFIKDISPCDLLPGTRELLVEIRATGLRTAIASASKNATEVLDRLGIRALFDAVSDGHSVERQKPAPDLFLHAAWQLGVPPDECVVVEDSAAGLAAAHACGMRTVGLGPPGRVAGADHVLPSLAGVRLADLLAHLSGRGAPMGVAVHGHEENDDGNWTRISDP
jgi:beta-phosphoglucomutase